MEPQLQSGHEGEPIVRVLRNQLPESFGRLTKTGDPEDIETFKAVVTLFHSDGISYSDQGVRVKQFRKLEADYLDIANNAQYYGYAWSETTLAYRRFMQEIVDGPGRILNKL